jgi:putative SOS response-associated peptidase YedK
MCGRFTLTADMNAIQTAFPWLTVPEGITPRYNIAPSQPIAVVPNDGNNKLDFYVWGLIPSWAKDPSIGHRLINARSETVTEKPSFRAAFRRRRCLVLADGFYEWRHEGSRAPKTPIYIKLNSGMPFAFAGLWENWFSKDGSQILSCTILTTNPNPLMESIHNRMPVILPPDTYDTWLQPGDVADSKSLTDLLIPYPDIEMSAYPVSTVVNNPRNETPACIQPLD